MKTKFFPKIPNHLIQEKSPCLLQHAYNPVDWYPWEEEAFQRARSENKPILPYAGSIRSAGLNTTTSILWIR
ncbi:MAG: DUF255 domain-containing protein [Desulfobacterales bacterium]|nr:hypothetical protein [Desulfobacter sp.]MDP6395313.1 DUF255 domain-containing protein [Desulfobacterales bacterium]MDP6682720.1 DUF255 domain-containing protein [Desulfobacterales bacterium]MDP6808057.1 DUF255 domain-containing protein [Desulfobacterales bacterium]